MSRAHLRVGSRVGTIAATALLAAAGVAIPSTAQAQRAPDVIGSGFAGPLQIDIGHKNQIYVAQDFAGIVAFMERVQGLGIKEKKLRLKIGGAIATGGSRSGGQEFTLASIHLWFHILEMIPIGITAPVTQWGVAGNAGYEPEAIQDDVLELKLAGTTAKTTQVAWMYGRKLATVATIVAAGRAASGLDLPDAPYGFALPENFPPELDELTGRP